MQSPLEIWRNIGIVDYKTNDEYRQRLLENGATQEDVDLLDPDKIDLVEFWSHAPNIDDSSIASSGMTRGSIRGINDFNRRMIDMSGVKGWMRLSPVNTIVEIGPGMGSFFETLPTFVHSNYLGFDIAPRFSRVTNDIDYVKNSYRNHKIDYLVSFNTFQHLSVATRKKYLVELLPLLQTGGIFVLNTGVYTEKHDEQIIKDSEGKSYIYTAGQLIELWNKDRYIELINECAGLADVTLEDVGYQWYPGVVTLFYRRVA